MAEIEQIKGVQFNFVSFVWKEISKIREYQEQGQYARALKALIDLIDYLPKDFQETMKFREKAKNVLKELRVIHTGSYQIDSFLSYVDSRNNLNDFAEDVLKDFISELSIKLDAKGYMEKKGGPVEHGGE